MKKIFLSQLRKLGLLHAFDLIFYYFNKIRFRSKNRRFKKSNPGVVLPPDYILYESYRLDHTSYFKDGMETARWIVQQINPYADLNGNILDWGCGPARIARHMPLLIPDGKVYGSDYNASTIEWCSQFIPGVEFRKNELNPPLSFDNSFFSAVYALSVFTHLSKENHYTWIEEIKRVLKPDGIFLFTTQGAAFRSKLSDPEMKNFLNGEIVVRGKVKEGHRSFSAFHPKEFMHGLFSDKWEVVKYIPGTMQSWGPEQDTWIVKNIS